MDLFKSVEVYVENFYTRVSSYIDALFEYPIKIVVLLVDLAIVFFLLYKVIKLLKGTRAMQLIKGIVALVIINTLSEWFNLRILNYLLNSFMTYRSSGYYCCISA